MARLKLTTGALLASSLVLLTSAAPPPSPVTPGVPISAARLQAACTHAAAQAVASSLNAGVTVAKLPNGPQSMIGRGFEDGTNFQPATASHPAFCQITGTFVTNPATGKTAGFLATFPVNWNGKYLQVGCSGHCGQFVVSNPAFPTVTATYPGDPQDLITRGYAVLGTDQGHQGLAGGTWAIK